jgi:hypothetical protein
LLQFIPCDFKLAFGALVSETIQPHVLHKDVQAVNKGPSGRDSAISICVCRENTRLLKISKLTS